MPTKTMVLFSGGADSTYVLYKLLTTTDDEITALLLERAEGATNKIAGEPEAAAKADLLVTELQKIRPFTYVHKFVTDDEINENTDHYYTYFISYAAPMLNAGTLDRIATGRTWEQQNQLTLRGSFATGTPSERAAQNLINLIITQGEVWNPLCTNIWHANFSRAEVLAGLPQNLLDLTISCVTPLEDGTPCGDCYKCLWEDKVKEMIANGKTSADINMYRFTKGLEYGGGNNLSAPMRFWLPLEMGRGFTNPKLDTKEKLQTYVQSGLHYTLRWRKLEGIWDIVPPAPTSTTP